MTPTPEPNRSERLQLIAAAVRGVLAGAVHAVLSWVFNHYIH
ncbi:hypothetical protein [Nonomuraea soli]|uniref:Uncharacterized protein n=1 Tax=Nonomuraea soli TaxID=1032476 RepID=A0A7W0HW16_9ACTN|nr:hypothetical protein [Nonomuraea soli]MBA2897730.1 hypothetical protein [Nonomuraea soli]